MASATSTNNGTGINNGGSVLPEEEADVAAADQQPMNDETCVVCQRSLFSTGQRVVKVFGGCNHRFHESCLQRSFRTRTRESNGNDEHRVCPACQQTTTTTAPRSSVIGLVGPICSFSDVASLLEGSSSSYHTQADPIAEAKDFVQCLLWSSAWKMTTNVELILNKLRRGIFLGRGGDDIFSVFPAIRDSGMIQACMEVMKENHSHIEILIAGVQLLNSCLDYGSTQQRQRLEIYRENAQGMAEILMQKRVLKDERFWYYSMKIIEMISEEFSEQTTDLGHRALLSTGSLTEVGVDAYNRIIPSVVNTMTRHPQHNSVQRRGCEFLSRASCQEECALTLIESGALLVLHRAVTRHHRGYSNFDANHAMENLLRRDLRLGSSS